MDGRLQDFHCDTLVRSTASTGTRWSFRQSSWKCLGNPDATGRDGLWWTWHLFISSIFGTKCWSWISSMTSSSKFASFKVKDTSSTADLSWHHCCSGVTSTLSMSHLVHPTSSRTSCQCSALQGPSTVQFAQSVSDIHLPVSSQLAFCGFGALVFKVASGMAHFRGETGERLNAIYAILHTTNTFTQMNWNWYVYIYMYVCIYYAKSKCNIVQSTSEVWWLR